MELHVVQAEFGDCLLLKYGTNASPRFILIDGGPPETYQRHLKATLQKVAASGAKLDLAMLSHVDNDHVIGLLDYFADLRAGAGGLPRPPVLWHNSFEDTIDPTGTLVPRLAAIMALSNSSVMSETGLAVNGIGEGRSLRIHALALGMDLNKGFAGGLITLDSAGGTRQFDNITLQVVGPTQANLQALRDKWAEWLDDNEGNLQNDDPFVMANSDQSVPNLSSIMVLAKGGGRTMLLTGDGRSDHLLEGLDAAGLLDGQGKMHVDVLKLPHHGSSRNITRTFFKKVTADVYVASANGKDDNPDLATLIWLVEAAKEQNRHPKIVVTNRTPSVQKLLEEYPKADLGYTLEVMPSNDSVMIV